MKFVIGDIHGEISKLIALLDHIYSVNNNPILIFVGDYIDKGENPKEVLDFLIALNKKNACEFIIGNHEYLWNLLGHNQETETYLLQYGAKSTIKSFGSNSIYETQGILFKYYKPFFDNLVDYVKTEKYVIVHSGIPKQYYSMEIEGIPTKSLLFNRYEFIKQEKLYLNKFKVIFGHTGFYYPYIDPFKIGVDTAACFLNEQPLTAFCIEEGFFINSDNEIKLINTFKNTFCPNIPRNKPWRENFDG